MEKRTLTVQELMAELHIGRKKAYEMVHSKDFPSFRIGRKILVSSDGLNDWLRNEEGKNAEES